MDLEKAYLHHILIFFESGDRSGPMFRTFVDNWFAHANQDVFLTKNGNPVWFNNPDPGKPKIASALRKMHFISRNAMEQIDDQTRGNLIKDHMIPIKVLETIVRNERPGTIESLRTLLMKFYSLGVITKHEDQKLNQAGLKSSMPEGWYLTQKLTARYDAINISPGINRVDRIDHPS